MASRGKITKKLRQTLDNFYLLIGSYLGKVIRESHQMSGCSTRVIYSTDFIGDALPAVMNAVTIETAGSPTSALVADQHKWAGTLDSNSEAESARIDMGDQRNFDPSKNLYFEAKCEFTRSGAAASYALIGFAHDYNADPDAGISDSVWFKIIDTGTAITCVVESDDGTTDSDDKPTSYTITSGTAYTFKIDMSNLSAVKFYINDQQVYKANLAVALMSNFLQPYMIIAKTTGASAAVLECDYLRVESDR